MKMNKSEKKNYLRTSYRGNRDTMKLERTIEETFDDETYVLNFYRMKRKTIFLKAFWDDHRFDIKYPNNCDYNTVIMFTYRSIERLLKKKAQYKKQPLQIKDANSIDIEGLLYNIVWDNTVLTMVQDKSSLMIKMNSKMTYHHLRTLYMERLWEHIRTIQHDFPSPKAREVKIEIKHFKGRWGECNHRKGLIRFNDALVHVPDECLDLTIYHEFCHLIYPNHQAEFHNLLESFVPQHRMLTKKLNTYGLYCLKNNELIKHN